MGKLSDSIALVTGGSSGIGLATARTFIAEGAMVIVTGRRQRELDLAVAELGPSASGIRGDIGSLEAVDQVYRFIRDRFGRLDILFANAGVGEFLPLRAATEQHVNEILAVNVKGTFFTVQRALPLMPDGSRIILNASIAASKGFPAFSVYAASKAAIRAFARGWIVELRDKRIRVNVVSPGTIPTPAYDGLGLSAEAMKEFIRTQGEANPSGRVGTPDEVAKAVLFLASHDSSYINGIELFVDGGISQV